LLKETRAARAESTSAMVALTSGGIDSTVMTYWLERKGSDVFPLFVDYGQRAAARELTALKQVLPRPLRRKLAIMQIPQVGRASASQLVGGPAKDFWMPHRNLLLVTLAAIHANDLGLSIVAIGAIGEASIPVPDADLAFFRVAAKTIEKSAGTVFRIVAPLSSFAKTDVVRMAKEYGVPVDKTWSCFLDGIKPCGRCPACKQRQAATKEESAPNADS
jgi:7-cyano-7-deazaguanine synthase